MSQRLKECGTENSQASSVTDEWQLPCRSQEEEQKQNKGLQNLLTLQNQEQKNLSQDQIRNKQEALNAPGKDDNPSPNSTVYFLSRKGRQSQNYNISDQYIDIHAIS